MSEYGLEIFNLNGGYLLSSEWSSYAIIESGVLRSSTTTFTQLTLGNTGTKLTLPARGLLFVQPSTLYDYSIVTEQNEFFLMGDNQVGVVANSRNSYSPMSQEVYNLPIQYFIAVPFEDLPSISHEGYGLEVYKADGELAFSTNGGYVSLIDSKIIPATSLTTGLYNSPLLYPLSNATSRYETWVCLNSISPFGAYMTNSWGDSYLFSINLHVGLEYTGAAGYSYSLRVSAKDVANRFISGHEYDYLTTFQNPRNILIAAHIQ